MTSLFYLISGCVGWLGSRLRESQTPRAPPQTRHHVYRSARERYVGAGRQDSVLHRGADSRRTDATLERGR